MDENIIPNVIVLDPPRSGIDDTVIKTIRKIKPEKIIYVSCNTSTLAKNINQLLDLYEVTKITPYDFFVETAHVETVCFLRGNTYK